MTRWVLLHGWATDHQIWQRQAAAFADRVLFDCPDLPRWEVSWLLEFLDQSPPAATVLLGWSLGSMLACEACAVGHYRPRALVLLAPCASFCQRPDYPWGVSPAILRGMRQRLRREPDKVCQEFYQQLLAPAEQDQWPALEELLPAVCKPDWLADGLDYLQQRDLRPLLSRVQADRILLLHGAEDRIVPPAHSRFLQEHWPQAELVLLPETGHVPFFTRAERVNQLLAGLV